MFAPFVFGFTFLPHFISARTEYLDADNSTAWSWTGFSWYNDSTAYNGSSTGCDFRCAGAVTFQGSSIEIFGVNYGTIDDSGGTVCTIDFSWSSNTKRYQAEPEGIAAYYNISFMSAHGFNSNEKSNVSFKVTDAFGVCRLSLDYAVVTAPDATISSTSSAQTSSTSSLAPNSTTLIASSASSTEKAVSSISKTPIGPIVGGVIGGITLVFLLIALVIWMMRRRRKDIEDHEVQNSVPAVETGPLFDGIESLPSNSLAISAREKQIFDDESNAPQGPFSSTHESNTATSSLPGSKAGEATSPTLGTELHPTVQARLEQLEAEIHEVRTQGALPPPS
ncbi:hypothetical protein DL96DRAFT_1623561 [Flagelloscypha sp. PMI_526]|nr:hypothetical protein DL96DRAFT_1623561 [Flagelloscypha sp. PMI_526]